MEWMCGDTQFDFKGGLGTKEAIFCLDTFVQNCHDQHQNVYMCFIDYEKAFDSIKHKQLMKRLLNAGADEKDLRIISNLYWDQSACVKLKNNQTTKDFEIRKGVRLGCILSPILFNLYVEGIFSDPSGP